MEVISEIRKSLRTYDMTKNKYWITDSLLNGDGYLYTYSITTFGELQISRGIPKDNDYEDIFVLSLFSYNMQEMRNFNRKLIGKFLYMVRNNMYNNLFDGDKIEYSLYKMPFGILLEKYREYEPIIQKEFRRFEMLSMYDCCQFSDNDNIGKLVRKNTRCLGVNRTGEKL